MGCKLGALRGGQTARPPTSGRSASYTLARPVSERGRWSCRCWNDLCSGAGVPAPTSKGSSATRGGATGTAAMSLEAINSAGRSAAPSA